MKNIFESWYHIINFVFVSFDDFLTVLEQISFVIGHFFNSFFESQAFISVAQLDS